jgi:hypothetical protein
MTGEWLLFECKTNLDTIEVMHEFDGTLTIEQNKTHFLGINTRKGNTSGGFKIKANPTGKTWDTCEQVEISLTLEREKEIDTFKGIIDLKEIVRKVK